MSPQMAESLPALWLLRLSSWLLASVSGVNQQMGMLIFLSACPCLCLSASWIKTMFNQKYKFIVVQKKFETYA